MIWRYDAVALIDRNNGRLSYFQRDWYATALIRRARVASFWQPVTPKVNPCTPSYEEFQVYCKDCRLLEPGRAWLAVDEVPWEVHAIEDDAARLIATRSFLNAVG